MKKIVCTITFCCFFVALWSQFENKLSDFGLKGNVGSVIEKEYQITNYDYNNKKEERRATFSFNKNGSKTEEKYANPSGDVLYHGIFTYSPSDELVEEKVNNIEYNKRFVKKYSIAPDNIDVNIEYEGDTPYMIEKYILDSRKKVTQKINYDHKEVVRMFNYTYNSSGMLQSETQQISETNINFKYAYDAKKQLNKKTEVDASGKVIHSQTYTYDKNGNVLTEVTSYANDPQKLTLTYKYIIDALGNWTEKQEYMDGKLFSLIIREISYFKN
jgi:hypothetical protein